MLTQLCSIEEKGVLIHNVPMEFTEKYGFSYSLLHGLMIEHYINTSRRFRKEVFFDEILEAYKDMNAADILQLMQQTKLQ